MNGEIFAQQRQLHRAANLREVAEVALKKLLVGEHGNAVRAGGFVGFRDGDGVEVFRDDTGARARFFHLGDQRERERVAVLVASAIERFGKAPEVISRQRRRAKIVGFREDFRDLAFFHVEDFFQARRQHEFRPLSLCSAQR